MDRYEGENENPSSLQKYIFTENNPINRIDPTGKYFEIAIFGINAITSYQTTVMWIDIIRGRHDFSKKGIDLLSSIEGIRLKPYDDDTGKTITEWKDGATIGIGHLIETPDEFVKYKKGLTETQAKKLFHEDLKRFIDIVNALLVVNQKQNQFDALVMFSFNIGEKGFAESSVLYMINNKLHRTEKYLSLEAAWKSWRKSGGRIKRGIINRRRCEWNVYSKNIYQKW